MSRTPYPDMSAAAWTVLLRAADGQPITANNAAQIVGPHHAAEAVAELYAKHLIEDDTFSPLANTMRRWHRQREAKP